MDYGIIAGVNPPDPSAGSPGVPPYAAFEAARYAMGDTLRYAAKMNLIAMEPRGELTSTGFALANPGREYLILQPGEAADPFTVTLTSGNYSVEWFHVNDRQTQSVGQVTAKKDEPSIFIAPFAEAGPAVLYLKHTTE
jgi:hypothetical protein